MSQQIMQSIKSIVSLNEEEENAFISILEIRPYKKKEFLLKEGKVCDKISYINSGCVRLFYNIEGNEKTVQFFLKDSWYTDYASFLTGKPTVENMQAIEDGIIVQFKKDDVNNLYNLYPSIERLGRIMAENAFISLLKLNNMNSNEEPEQRYLNLIKQRPEVVEKIPQHYIASYLGLQPQSLSRIRKRIFKKSNLLT
jgi:CRP/FNR family transcriptional regulator, anaerobic regulatory protein